MTAPAKQTRALHAGRPAGRAPRGGVTALLAAAALAAGMVPVPGAAAPAVMPAGEIAAGMTGIGKTVIAGTAVVDFDVKVLGVLHNAGPAGDLVLFRASGTAIQSVGGIAAGMSGSPIYLRGKLAGALAYTFQSSDPMVGLFTPIDDMFRILPRPAPSGRRPPGPGVYALTPTPIGGRTIRRVLLADPRGGVPSDTLVAVPAETPLFVSGLSGTGLASLAQALLPMGLAPVAGGARAGLPASLPLGPGSAIGVALLQGDIGAYAIGTLTYRDGNRILAFGHPFTGIGPASYLLMNATIIQVIRGQQQNIKVGAVGAPVGIVSQDRPAGIAGTIGTLPRMFGVRVRVVDDDAGLDRTFNFQVIPSTELAPLVVPIGSQGAIERALNRSGQGTATVRMTLYGRGLPRPVVRDNMFYGAAGIAARALAEVPRAMNLLFDNDFRDLEPTGVSLDVHVTSAEHTATIVEAEAPHDPVPPGGTVHVRVTVRPFRAAPETHEVALTIPANAVPGPAMLVVHAGGAGLPGGGGGLAALIASAGGGQGTGPKTLEEAIRAFETDAKNTDVVVELMGGVPPRAGPGDAPAKPATQWTTSWVMRGRVQLPIVIKGGTH